VLWGSGGLHRRPQVGSPLPLPPQAICILDPDGYVREWNPAAASLLDWTREQVVGQSFEVILSDLDRPSFSQAWQRLKVEGRALSWSTDHLHRDRTFLPVQIVLAPIQDSDGSFGGVVGTLSSTHPVSFSGAAASIADTADRGRGKHAPATWERDEVTGLPGRRWLQRRLLAHLPEGLQRAVAVIDVDAFALVNQVYGPEAGDQVLAELARRFTTAGAPAAMGRWQADEFLFIVDAISANTDLETLLHAAAAAARDKLVLAQDEIRLTVSAGWTSTDTVPLEALFKSASAAMASAKTHGRDRIVLFDPSNMPISKDSGLRMAHDLQRAFSQDELRLHYQPIIELSTNDVVGVEALVRWERPGVGLLTPEAFIDVAERTGQIVALGEWVIGTACEAAKTFAATRVAPLRVSINVSARQLSDPNFLPVLRSALHATGCDPGSLVIEVTETALLHDLEGAAATLEEVRDLGLELDLDDFGTGYSSLLYLRHFPVDRIKIDQAFIAGLGSDAAATAIVASTIALAHSMGITAIAEGVETTQQLGLLRQMGCDYAQGYLLSHPLPSAELMTWLGKQTPSRLLDRTGLSDPAPGAQQARPVPRQDRQAQVADSRDVVGDRRDRAGDIRDRAADLRDNASDLREQVRDRREALANERERILGQRERAFAAQDSAGPASRTPSESAAPGQQNTTSSMERAAASNSAQGAEERVHAAAERNRAHLERDLAQAGRSDAASAREQATVDRSAQQPDRGVAALDRSMHLDALTGAYQRPAGLSAIEVETEQAQRDGDTITVANVRLSTHDVAGQPVEQLAEDNALVFVANAFGAALRAGDLLVRTGTRELLCLLRGLSPSQVQDQLALVQQGLAAVPHLAANLTVGYAVLHDGETIKDLLSRASDLRNED
jgi:diguanylate cyclase (GGDEF)-like protein/PAS domain S-box-containing protein